MAGKHFASDEEVISAVDCYFANLLQFYFKNRIQLLQKRWTKCIYGKKNNEKKINLFLFLKPFVLLVGQKNCGYRDTIRDTSS